MSCKVAVHNILSRDFLRQSFALFIRSLMTGTDKNLLCFIYYWLLIGIIIIDITDIFNGVCDYKYEYILIR
jgi:hypothetical protein